MRILCIIDCLGSGGAQRQMTYLACGLKQRGHDVELFLTHPGADHFRPEIEAAGIPIHGVDRRGHTGFSLAVLLAIRRLLRTGFDGILSFQLSANGYAVLARLTAGERSPRLVCGERTSGRLMRLRSRIATVVAGLLADAVVSNSHANAAYLRRVRLLAAKVSVIWNGYPLGAGVDSKPDARGGSELSLLLIGRYSCEKNGRRLLQAIQRVHARCGWMPSLYWAGARQNDFASLQMRQDMEELIATHPALASRCSFVGECKDVLGLYRSHDALILPSLFEGLPNVVCEAMIAGTPVLASRVCDNPLLLGEEERGLLFDPLDPESIADAIVRFHEMSASARAEMARRARLFAEQHLSVDRMVDSYEALLKGEPDVRMRAIR